MRINWCQAVYDEKEIQAVVHCMQTGWLGGNGKLTRQFENTVAEAFAKEYGVFVNSGSSGLLATLNALRIEKGAEIITPACNFSTMVSTIVHSGMIPHFVDVALDSYVVEPEHIEAAIGPNTQAVLVPLLVGSIPKLDAIKKICDKYDLWLIEDSCDQIGGTLNGQSTGAYSDISLTSFYGSHHITAGGGGGMICVNDLALQQTLYSLRDWGHKLVEREADRFTYQLNNTYYDSHFTYDHLAFNLKACEMQAAFGIVQMEKLPKFNETRKKHFQKLYAYFSTKDFLRLPKELPEADVSWIAFPLTLLENSPIKRHELMKALFELEIQSRVLFSGNILYHPMMKGVSYKQTGSLKNSDTIFENSLMIGCHHAMTDAMSDYMIESFEKIFSR